jgi:hypothetical protein
MMVVIFLAHISISKLIFTDILLLNHLTAFKSWYYVIMKIKLIVKGLIAGWTEKMIELKRV